VKTISKKFLMNDDIRVKEVRAIAVNGDQLGIMDTRDIKRMAEELDLDLVMISPNAQPPVCKIMDYGKQIYEQAKKEKEARKNQKIVTLKEIRVSPTIEENDISIKAKNAKKFLTAGDKVKITVRFRGREAEHSFIGRRILEKFITILEEYSVIEKPARLEGRNMILILAPKKA
jgi:translation initiation factor IF-3